MQSDTSSIVPLNRTEHGYAAIDGMAATMIQPYMVRFGAPIPESEMRQTLRELVSCYPRLRGVIEPGLHRYHMRILPDDDLLDQLFDVAYRVEPHIDAADPAALEAYQNQMLNEVLPLERGLCVRMRFIAHPQQPVLFFGPHHLFCDGRTNIQMIGDIVKRLNGVAITPQALEAPSMLGSVAPHRWWQWPLQVLRSRQHKVNESRQLASLHVQRVPTRVTSHFSINAVRHHRASVGTEPLRAAARKMGVSLNTFLVAAIAQSFLDQAPRDPLAAAVIRISVDLRRYYPASKQYGPLWGNHVGAFLVTETQPHKPLLDRVKSIDASIKEGLARYDRREMCWTYLIEEALPWAGRTLIGYVGRQLKKKDRFPKISCHATSLGDVSVINPPGASIRVIEFIPIVASVALLMGMLELDGVLYLPVSWQRSDTTVQEVDAYLAQIDQTLERLVKEASAG